MPRHAFKHNATALHKIARGQANVEMSGQDYLAHLLNGTPQEVGRVYIVDSLSVEFCHGLDMSNVTGIAENLDMEGCKDCTLGASIVGGTFNAEKTENLQAPNLITIGERALISRSNSLNAPLVEFVDGPVDMRDMINSNFGNTGIHTTGKVYTGAYRPELVG